MMKTGGKSLLLDTHAWLWIIGGMRSRMSAAAWRAIELAAEQQAIALSEISFWEVAVKSSKKKFLTDDTAAWLKQAAKLPGIGVVHVDRDTLVDSALLDIDERDPADRILIATALRYDLRLVTADEMILNYAQRNPRLAVLDARV